MSARGYTLLEMVIVTAIVASLVALTIPALSSALGSSELGDAAKQLRTALAQARRQAIESGNPCQFRFQLGGSAFEVRLRRDAQTGQALSFTSRKTLTGSATAGLLQPPGGQQDTATRRYELAPGIRFEMPASGGAAASAAGQFGLSPRAETVPQLETNSTESPETVATAPLETGRWSEPIVFYPNGSTTNARIRLVDGRQRHVEIRLRGLTGTATMGPVLREESSP